VRHSLLLFLASELGGGEPGAGRGPGV